MKKAALLFLALPALACARTEEPAPAQKALSCVSSEGGSVSVENAWVREQQDASAMTAAYFSLCNGGSAPVTLIGLSTPIAGMTELHETSRGENGVVSMAPTGAITLAPGERVIFEPGGKHAMLMSLSGPVASGDHAALTLEFEDGASIAVDAVAKSLVDAATGNDGHDGH